MRNFALGLWVIAGILAIYGVWRVLAYGDILMAMGLVTIAFPLLVVAEWIEKKQKQKRRVQ